MLDPDRLTTVALAVLGVGGLATIEAIPGAAFILQAAGIGTLIGTAYAYLRRRHKRDIDIGETIAALTCASALFAVAAELFSWLT